MSRRITQGNRQRQFIGLRTILYTGTLCLGILFGLSLFITQFLRDETGNAATNPMVFANIEVKQDTTTVFGGTINQEVLSVNIKTKGNNNRLSLNSIIFSIRGTSTEAKVLIQNARLWTTGSENYFSPIYQMGPTITKINSDDFTFSNTLQLHEGDNYLWLTYDIIGNTVKQDLVIDAECISFKIGTLDYQPQISAPPGAIKLLNNTPYFSTGNGDLSSLNSWNSTRDGSGLNPKNFNDSSATFHVQSGHILQNKLTACIPAILIERGGVIKSSSEIKTAHVEIQNGGTYFQETVFTNTGNIQTFVIRNNGNYVHANAGKIPGKTKNIEHHSNIIFTNFSNTTFTDEINYGNVVIDSKENKTTDFSNAFNQIHGNLEIRSTGKNEYLFTSSNGVINIKGNLVINGGRIIFCSRENDIELHVGNNLSIKSGWFSDAVPGQNNRGNLNLFVGSLVNLQGGDFKMTGKNSRITFNNSITRWYNSTNCSSTLPDLNIEQRSTLEIKSAYFGEIESFRELTIKKGGKLNCEFAEIKGTGTFDLEAGGTLSTMHPEGISSESENGSIQTSKRKFSSSANYVYAGNVSPQFTGNFKTSPIENTVNNFEIAKTSISNIVVLNQDVRVSGVLLMKKGSINKNSFQLTNVLASQQISALP